MISGSQQGLDLAGKLFLDPGDLVVCESPTYTAALSAFRAYECGFLPIDTDDDGMIIEDLERKLAANPPGEGHLRHPHLPESHGPHLVPGAQKRPFEGGGEVRSSHSGR